MARKYLEILRKLTFCPKVLALAVVLPIASCAPDERHESAFYKICKDKNKSEDLAHTVNEILALVSSPSSCEQAHNYLMKTSSLSLAGKNIKALEPLAGLPQLVELNLSDNKIKDLGSLVDLGQLKFLYLQNNQLTDIAPLAGLPKLAVLNVSQNQLTDMAVFAKLSSLSRLYASQNALIYEPAEGFAKDFPALTKLSVAANKGLAGLPKELVAAATELDISGTAMGDLSAIAENKALETFVADNVGTIADISPLAGKKALAMVSLKSNKVKDITVLAEAKALRHLDITFNEVTSLTPLAASAQLKALFIEGNPIANSKNQTKDNCPQGPDVPAVVKAVCQGQDPAFLNDY